MNEYNSEIISRRNFINLAAGGIAVATLLVNAALSVAAEKNKIKAIAFDAFVIFDPKPVFDAVNIYIRIKQPL